MTAHVKQEKGKDVKGGESTTQVSASKRTRSYESRKVRKPLMEKKRRARINTSLNELKRILLEANGSPAKKESKRPAKLEKADILELTVRYIESLHNPDNKSVSTNVTSTSVSDTDDDNSNSRVVMARSPGLKIDITNNSSTSATIPHNNNQDNLLAHNQHNIESETTPYIHGFAECIRLVENAIKTSTCGQIPTNSLQEKLKSHLGLLQRDKEPKGEIFHLPNRTRVSGASPPMSLYDPDIGFGSGDEHDVMTSRSSDSPASISQLSPLSGRSSNWTEREVPCSEKAQGTLLIPTRMSNGEIAFVLKYGDEQQQNIRTMRGQGNYYYNQGAGPCCGEVETPFNNSFAYAPSSRGFQYGRTFTDNHFDVSNSRVWRPW